MTEVFSNFAQSSLSKAIGTNDTIISVASAATFPATGNFRIVVQMFDASGLNPISNPEIMLVTAVSGNNFTVTRAAESTTALGFRSGAKVVHIVTAAVMTALEAGGGGGSGTVTSVTFTGDGTVLSSTPSGAVTTSGTLTASLNTQAKNVVLAGPGSGSNAAPTFRALVGADLPNPASTTLGGVKSLAAVSHNFLTQIGTDGSVSQAQPTPTDVSLGNVTNDVQTKAAIVPNTAPTAGQLLVGNAGGTAYAPVSSSGNVTISSSGVMTIGAAQVTNAMLAGSIAASNLVGTDIATVGTITSGTWHGTKIGDAYGGTNADSSASTGVAQVNSGTWSWSTALANGTTATTQTALDNSTKVASTAYTDAAVAAAVAGINPAVAVQYATTAAGNTSGLTYSNGVSGVGATFTGANNTVTTIDGHTFVVGDVGITRLLVKNDTQSPSGAFNGVYLFTALHTAGTGDIFTRALDYDTPSDINNTGAIPVISGTANASTTWVQTANIVTVGTTPLAYTQFSYNPANVVTSITGDGTIHNNSASTGAVTLTLANAGAGTVLGNATSSSATPTYTATPQLGKSGTLGSITMGNATSGLLTLQPITGALGTVTVSIPAATDTLVNLGGTQTLTNKTLTSPTLTTPALGTPASGNLSNCTNIPVGQMTALGVGSIILAYTNAGSAAGTTTAAANINTVILEQTNSTTLSTTIFSSGDSLAGTWRCLQTGTSTSTITLFQRTA